MRLVWTPAATPATWTVSGSSKLSSPLCSTSLWSGCQDSSTRSFTDLSHPLLRVKQHQHQLLFPPHCCQTTVTQQPFPSSSPGDLLLTAPAATTTAATTVHLNGPVPEHQSCHPWCSTLCSSVLSAPTHLIRRRWRIFRDTSTNILMIITRTVPCVMRSLTRMFLRKILKNMFSSTSRINNSL